MAHTGEVRTKGFRGAISVMRVFIVTSVALICTGTGLLLQLPVAISGLMAGIAITALLVGSKSLFELTTISCPSCSSPIVTVKNFGSYQCSHCQQKLRIEENSVHVINM